MPEFKQYFCDGEPITNEKIKSVCLQNNRLMLIKFLRSVSGMGLKDTKDAVEQHCSNLSPTFAKDKNWEGCSLNYEKAISYFEKISSPLFTAADLTEGAAEDDKHTQKILEGIECVSKNWQKLGYESKMMACKAILQNFTMEPL